jgi:hypothetical protein
VNVAFPRQQRWEPGWEYLEFPAEVDGGRVACRITVEAVGNHHGANAPTQQEAESALPRQLPGD